MTRPHIHDICVRLPTVLIASMLRLMATRTLSFRIPDQLYGRIRALRPYVAFAADVPRDVRDVTLSDVAARALARGVDLLEGYEKTAKLQGEFTPPEK